MSRRSRCGGVRIFNVAGEPSHCLAVGCAGAWSVRRIRLGIDDPLAFSTVAALARGASCEICLESTTLSLSSAYTREPTPPLYWIRAGELCHQEHETQQQETTFRASKREVWVTFSIHGSGVRQFVAGDCSRCLSGSAVRQGGAAAASQSR